MTACSELIKELRQKVGLSQKQLYYHVGYTAMRPSSIGNIEAGLCPIPWDKVKEFAEVLNVSEKVIYQAIYDDEFARLQKKYNGKL